MSQSYNSRRGSQRGRRMRGNELWSSRPGYHMATKGRVTKQRTHRLERIESKRIARDFAE